jgi:hypothetical protein
MTIENQFLLFAKISFLAVLTMLIVLAGNSTSNTQMQTIQVSGH